MRREKTKYIIYLLLALLPWLAPGSARAEATGKGEEKVFDTFTVYWENDLLLRTDGDYTNGVRFSWSTPFRRAADDSRLPEWGREGVKLLSGAAPGEGRAVSLSLGQSIYTQADIYRDEPDPRDRPYAGYAYLSAAFHFRGAEVNTTWEFQAGVVGPLAFAEQTQDFFHDLSGIGRARGWDYQLDNEPTLELIGARQWLLAHAEGEDFSYDFIPHLGGQIGNVAILANLGGELRWGWRLPKSFGTCTIRGGCKSNSAFASELSQPGLRLHSCYLFAGGEGRWVLRDIFLDGNNFTDSPSVEREPLVAEMLAGISVRYWAIQLTCAAVYRSREFETQASRKLFGAFSLSLTY